MTTDDVIRQLKISVGVDVQPKTDELTDIEATVKELLYEEQRATAALYRRIEKIREDFQTELTALASNEVHTSSCGSYAFRVFSKGRIVKVSIEDAELLKSDHGKRLHVNVNGYCRVEFLQGGGFATLSHIVLPPRDGLLVDHKNTDRLDNRRENLRLATRSQNGANIRTVRSLSGLKGVAYMPRLGKYAARGQTGGRNLHLGLFEDKESAGYAYDSFMERTHGEFAATNQSLGLLPKISGDPLISKTDAPLSLVGQ